MKFKPYPFQEAAIKHAVAFLSSASMGDKQLYAAPTGVGKSVVELLVKQHFPDCYLVTPRDEIVSGMMEKLGLAGEDPWQHGIWTPISLRNRMLSGEVRHPKQLIFDETHHQTATSWQELELLSGVAPAIGYTASPYRGSPKSTREFREVWGEPLWLITYEEAIAEGFIKLPRMSILPLVDDDIIDVSGGEFSVTSIDGVTVDRLGDLADHSKQWHDGSAWDKATIYAMPSSRACGELAAQLTARGLPCAVVSAATPKDERATIFRACEERILAILHINIVQEGVDLRLERLVDVAPTLSPVKWVQQIGRIMRPTVADPEYICTNRNVLRHAYILEGVVPLQAVTDTEKFFGPTTRAHTRVLGLEAIGRFKPTTTKLLSGANIYVYNMSALIGTAAVEFCCIVHPTRDPIWATKVNTRNEDGEKQWGTWVACEPPNDIRGFSSKGSKEPSEKQLKWWHRSAARCGLDPTQEITRKSFCALPVLNDLGERL